ncbi:response regulator [Kamptonema sp. UHCC 0994]|uniref:response regulator n=1 Tax=Kamptonema sp. UHCC 0994 TaxID=3031329 RepID=UPI0023B92BED|nr:response regulator [Kamptonema sp. UHCC 0994]MDF0552029.1 response regulator [Kamptonema sp. UHCC 0994]
MSATATGCKMLSDTLAVLSQRRATGKLLLEHGEQKWQLYFFDGCMLYATGGLHRSRRWYRAIADHCPDFRVNLHQMAAEELWEYQLLQHGIAQREMSVEQAKGIIRSSIYEVFFSIANQSGLKRKWHLYKQPLFPINPRLLISKLESEQMLLDNQELCQKWEAMGLSHLDPDLAPILKQSASLESRVSSDSLLALSNHFNGQNTLWDIALKKKQCLTVATRTLYHFVKQGLIDFRTVQDLPSPLEQWRLAAAIVQPVRPLIACIDDSRAVCEFLEQILVPAGYRVVKIQDPMKGIATLAEQKPALIFLDVIMPKASGFTLCNFLRQTPAFRDTPIVFLTGQDGIVDRTRAKWTGATDFVSKPPTAEKVLQVVEKYLNLEGDRSQQLSNNPLMNPSGLSLAGS